jgi:hypothetical protein
LNHPAWSEVTMCPSGKLVDPCDVRASAPS